MLYSFKKIFPTGDWKILCYIHFKHAQCQYETKGCIILREKIVLSYNAEIYLTSNRRSSDFKRSFLGRLFPENIAMYSLHDTCSSLFVSHFFKRSFVFFREYLFMFPSIQFSISWALIFPSLSTSIFFAISLQEHMKNKPSTQIR